MELKEQVRERIRDESTLAPGIIKVFNQVEDLGAPK